MQPTRTLVSAAALLALSLAARPGVAQDAGAEANQQQTQQQQQQQARPACQGLPDHGQLTEVLRRAVTPGDPSGNGGLGNHAWAVTVNREGLVCAVARSGNSPGEQWLGSRGIAASKAFSANAFSLPSFAISTANLYFPAQPGQSLYGIGNTNPPDPAALYAGQASSWGTAGDPLVGRRPGGVVVFGGGLALYTEGGELVGALGVSGDKPCTDHLVAWKARQDLRLDHVPAGNSQNNDDNIIYDLTIDPATGEPKSASGFGHPECGATATRIAEELASAGSGADGAASP